VSDKAERLALVQQLEGARKSRVLVYITGDRQPDLGTHIGTDVFPFFYDALSKMGHQKQIDLLLYSIGGATMAAWGLVNLLREFADRLCVLIPFKAHSSATLIALGANEIVMTRTGQLSPVDPNITSPFNPVLPNQVPGTPPQFLPVSVEDVIGFMDLIRNEANVTHEENITEAVKLLATNIHPLALGNVYRAKEQIRMLSRRLLAFHMDAEGGDKEKVAGIVATLTRELYSHDYPVGRREAKETLGLKIADCPEGLEKLVMDAFLAYSDEMELYTAYSPEVALGTQTTKTVTFDRAFIETLDASYVFRTKREVKRLRIQQQNVPLDVFQQRTLEEGWMKLK
jgi:hypothetical protein